MLMRQLFFLFFTEFVGMPMITANQELEEKLWLPVTFKTTPRLAHPRGVKVWCKLDIKESN